MHPTPNGYTPCDAQAQAATPRPIVYAVVIDGLDGDRVDEGKAPFISSLLGGHATYYRESRSIMIAETNPNHVAMMTGAYGDASGLPGNNFALYAPLANEDTCEATGPVDETRRRTGCTSGRSRGAAARRCAPVRRYRVSWTPRGARYDLTRRTGHRTRALLRNSPRTHARVKLRSGHQYRARVRMRAASGKPGRWASRGVRVLRCLRAPRARPGHGHM